MDRISFLTTTPSNKHFKFKSSHLSYTDCPQIAIECRFPQTDLNGVSIAPMIPSIKAHSLGEILIIHEGGPLYDSCPMYSEVTDHRSTCEPPNCPIIWMFSQFVFAGMVQGDMMTRSFHHREKRRYKIHDNTIF
jgi:hypothetical protein